MSTAVFCLRTQDLSWQDRTINIEFMVAPAKSQLLYNKHKGLKTKYDQESYYLEREKESFMKSFKTERRLMKRKKELYSKRRNDIIMRRASGDSRRRFSINGRVSAPPRLEEDSHTESKSEIAFITEIPERLSKSAGARTQVQEVESFHGKKTPERTVLLPPTTPDMRAVSPSVSTRTVTPGKPFLKREKSVRFQNMDLVNNTEHSETVPLETPIHERIKNFLAKQADFNKRGPTIVTDKNGKMQQGSRPVLARKRSSLNLNLDTSKLETAFNEFCIDRSSEGFSKLVKCTTKMRAEAKNARNSLLIAND